MKKEDIANAIRVRPIGKVEVKKMEGPYEVSVDLPPLRKPQPFGPGKPGPSLGGAGKLIGPAAILRRIKVKV